MSIRATPPFRADHVGSLLRPAPLARARSAHRAGELDDAGLRAVEDAAIVELIERQRAVGLRTVTDGELRRGSWHMDFIYALGGVRPVAGESLHVRFTGAEGGLDYAPPAIEIGKLSLPGTLFGDAFAFLRDHAHADQTAKLTIPSPSMVHYRGGDSSIDDDAYPDLEPFWSDLADVYRAQLEGVYALGCRYLQLDDTSLAYVNDPAQREHIVQIGGDPEHLHERYIATINRAIADRPDDLTVTIHLCRGNNQSMWAAEGDYELVAEALFGQLEVDGYFLEYDDERSGGFAPLRHVPPGKQVVLGLVTTKRGALEDPDALRRRIEQAARHVDVEQLCLSPQCGFSSTEEGNRLTVDEQFAKLELIVSVAEQVWG